MKPSDFDCLAERLAAALPNKDSRHYGCVTLNGN